MTPEQFEKAREITSKKHQLLRMADFGIKIIDIEKYPTLHAMIEGFVQDFKNECMQQVSILEKQFNEI